MRVKLRGNRLACRTSQRRAKCLPLGDVGTNAPRGFGMILQVALDHRPAIRWQLAVHIGVQILFDDRTAEFAA